MGDWTDELTEVWEKIGIKTGMKRGTIAVYALLQFL
jgi:hypothetical protein